MPDHKSNTKQKHLQKMGFICFSCMFILTFRKNGEGRKKTDVIHLCYEDVVGLKLGYHLVVSCYLVFFFVFVFFCFDFIYILFFNLGFLLLFCLFCVSSFA